MHIGQLIKELRLEKGMTQEVLAEKTEISVRTIQRIEKGEVAPRSYTLLSIASALEVEYDRLVNFNKYDLTDENATHNSIWMPILHLSGLFILLFPPILIWLCTKNKVKGINKHAADVVNFQISMLVYLVSSSFLAKTFIGLSVVKFLGIVSTILIIINAVRVMNNQSYKYPLSIKFLKS
jgi:transcriptional regulator with XRE-family HTH domain